MSVSINISGASTSAIPSSGEMNSFSQGLKSQSTDNLLTQRMSNSTPDWQKDAIDKELQNRANANQGTDGTSGSDDSSGDSSSDIAQLMKKLQDGTISQEEMQKLAKLLGVDPSQLEAMKGQGSTDTSGSSDISGG